MSYGNAVECDICLKIEFFNDRLQRAEQIGLLPPGWMTISGDQGFKDGSIRAIFCSIECGTKYLSLVGKKVHHAEEVEE